MKESINLSLNERVCECCGSNSYEPLWNNRFITETRNLTWNFNMSNVICKNCGFVYVSAVPNEESLNLYYGDSWTAFSGQKQDCDIEARLNLFTDFLNKDSIFVEVGSSNTRNFGARVQEKCSRYITVEINSSVNSDYKSIYDLPDSSTDVIAHYFVLEHIPNVRRFLSCCYDKLKDNGIMVVEVPDLKLYKDDLSPLILHEHLNHFTINTLTKISSQLGFELVYADNSKCSREYGFVMVLRKNSARSKFNYNFEAEFTENKRNFERALEDVKELTRTLEYQYNRLCDNSIQGKKAVLWAANNELLRFLNGAQIPENTVVVDSNPMKRTFSDCFPVYHPDEVKEHIISSDLIFIFTQLNSEDILQYIKVKYNKVFLSDNIFVYKVKL